MTRRVSFEVLTLAGIFLLTWIGIRVWHIFSSSHPGADHPEAILPFFVFFVWFACRRVQRELDHVAGQVDGSVLDRLSQNSMTTGYLCYSLICALLLRHWGRRSLL